MPIYFDHAATTPVCPAAAAALTEALAHFGNPSSLHPHGTTAAQRLETHREVVAGALSCSPTELFFTSGGTESNNWAIQGAVELGRRTGKHILTTAVEHASVLEPVKALAARGYEVTYLKPDKTGHISPSSVVNALRPDTVLVSMMLVNNELGTLLPVRETAAAIRDAGCPALLHVDAVQGFLKVPFTPSELGCDLLSVSGHKVGAPKGIGALYIRETLRKKFPPLLLGGGQEGGLRPGTQSTLLLAAFAAAVGHHDPETMERVRQIRDYAARVLGGIRGVEVVTVGEAPHILPISLPAFSGQSLVEALGSRGVCVSSGSACHRGKPSHVFAAMPLSPTLRLGSVRLSFGEASTTAEVDTLAALLTQICETGSLLFER